MAATSYETYLAELKHASIEAKLQGYAKGFEMLKHLEAALDLAKEASEYFSDMRKLEEEYYNLLAQDSEDKRATQRIPSLLSPLPFKFQEVEELYAHAAFSRNSARVIITKAKQELGIK